MTTQERINILEIKDYFSMRKNKQASNLCWSNVKYNNLPNGKTLWQLFNELDDYDSRYEPSISQIELIIPIIENFS